MSEHKKINYINIATWAIIILSFAVAIYYYPKMPLQMASHWNAEGNVNGWMLKPWALFLMPVLSLVMLFFFRWLPKIDPLRENVAKFKDQYNIFILGMIGFLFYIYILTIVWNLGSVFNMTKLMIPGIAVVFFICGNLIEHAKRNWFIGIRTPWTMSSDHVWDKTHELGAKAFRITAFIMLLGVFFETLAIWFVLVPVFLAVIVVFVYSYYVHKNHKSR